MTKPLIDSQPFIAVKQDITHSAFKYTPSWSYTLFKTHLNPNYKNLEIIKENGVKRVVVTYRDLRDVALSRYHRLLKFPTHHPILIGKSKGLRFTLVPQRGSGSCIHDMN